MSVNRNVTVPVGAEVPEVTCSSSRTHVVVGRTAMLDGGEEVDEAVEARGVLVLAEAAVAENQTR